MRRPHTAVLAIVLVGLSGPSGCASYISPLQPPPYRDQVAASYDFVSPIGVYADCGRKGETPLEGEALAAFTVFVRPSGATTDIQINSKMRTLRLGQPGKLRMEPGLECVSTTRWEPNLVDSVRRYVRE